MNVSNVARAHNREIELQCLLDKYSPNFVILTEVELPVSDNSFSVPNYLVLYPEPTANRYRLLLLVRLELVPVFSPAIIRKSHLDIWVKLVTPIGNVAIGGIYRQWGKEEETELAVIHGHLAEIGATFKKAIVAGDMNLAMCRRRDPSYYRRALLEQHLLHLEACGFQFMGPDTPTYTSHGRFTSSNGSTGHRMSILDHVYALGGGDDLEVKVEVLPDAITDHRPVIARIGLQAPRRGVRQVLMRNYKSLNGKDLIMELNATHLSKVYALDDVDEILHIITGEIVVALDKLVPAKLTTIKDRSTPLHLAPDTLQAMAERDKAATTNSGNYRALRNKASHLVRRDRLATNVRYMEEAKGDPSRAWTLANSALGKNAQVGLPYRMVDSSSSNTFISGDEKLAAHMNSYFLAKIDLLRERVEAEQSSRGRNSSSSNDCSSSDGNPGSCNSSNSNSSDKEFQFSVPSERAVLRTIMGLRNTKAEGVDKIPVLVLKLAAPVIAGPVAHLIRVSFDSCKVPKPFKMAIVTPLHKGKSKPVEEASSYRPVSILPALSKVLERVVLQQLNKYMDDKMPNGQFGFRPRRSTTAAIVAAHGAWSSARALGKVVGIAAYDLSAAFDTLDHARVIDKLRILGVGAKERAWFAHYLAGRQQQVQYRDSCSGYREVRYGVPQGSILGPLLFLCLVMDLPDAINSSNSLGSIGSSGYADDTVAWSAGDTVEEVKKDLEAISASVAKYMAEHSLVLNRDKTQVLISGGGAVSDSSNSILIDGVNVLPDNKIEVLGVRFDCRLTPSPHQEATWAAARSLACASRRLAQHLPRTQLQQVLRALLVGKLGYGCAALPPRLSASDPLPILHHRIQTAINDCARITVGSTRADRVPVEELLQSTGFPSFNRLVVKTIALEAWKAIRCRIGPGGSLGPVGELLCPAGGVGATATATAAAAVTTATRRTRSAAAGLLPPPTKFKVKSFTWVAREIWNGSPLLREATTAGAARCAAIAIANNAPL